MKDPPAQRRNGAGRIELDRAREDLVEALEELGTVDELRDGRGLLAIHARGHVDEHQLPHEVGGPVGKRERREPTERHADDDVRFGRELAERLLERGRAFGRPVDVIVAVPGMTVTRKVHGEQWAVERERDCVPGVGVLRAAVHEHKLGRLCAPREGADGPRARPDLDASHGRRSVPRNPEFLRVLVEERKLVVDRGSGHEW